MAPTVSKHYKLFTAKFPFLSPLLDDKAPENARVNAWVSAIEQQDMLFSSALDVYKESTGFTMASDFNNNTLLNNPSTRKTYNNFIVSLFYLLQFQYPAASGSAAGRGEFPLNEDTKLGSVLKNNDLVKISFFPATVTNTLVQTIAGMLHSLATDSIKIGATSLNMESVLTYAHADHYISKLLADQFTGLLYANSYTLTVGPPVETFYIDQSLTEAKAILNGASEPFFTTVIKTLAALCSNKVTVDKLFVDDKNKQAGCPKYCAGMEWPVLVAHLARYYMLEKSLDKLFSIFGKCDTPLLSTKSKSSGEPLTKDYVPDSVAEPPKPDSPTLDGVSILEILRSLGRPRFVFLVHLRAVMRDIATQFAIKRPLDALESVLYDLADVGKGKETPLITALSGLVANMRAPDESARESALTALQVAVKALPN